MPLEYRAFDPSPCNFPRPRVSILPRIYIPADTEERNLVKGCVDYAGQGQLFSRGRYALGEAYRLAGLDCNSVLLAPAYHCVTMLDPALSLGAAVRLYPLTADLLPEPAALEVLASQPGKPVKVLLATHFFGFVRDLSWLKNWCEERDICFVEDCSHALFTERFQAHGAGQYGRFVASSPYKFFPSTDGGWLWAADAGVFTGPAPREARWVDELRAIKQRFDAERQPDYGHESRVRLDGELAAILARSLVPGADEFRQRAAQSAQYDDELTRRSALRTSRWIINHASLSHMVERRRANYQYWLEAVADLQYCRPLYPELPADVVPYMFPLHIEFPMPHFYLLKQLAMPLWRWDEMAVSDCPVAADYRLHLLHLPCHQSLSADELAWMVVALRAVLSISVDGDRI